MCSGTPETVATPGRRAPILLGLAALVAAGAVGGGWWWREGEAARQRAIALIGGDPERGRGLLRQYGCAGCHTIPGVTGAVGKVGPSLDGVAARVYLGGAIENTPANLLRWIDDPRAIEPRSAMPRSGAPPRDVRDIATYVYTLR
jgi:cytochrome c2